VKALTLQPFVWSGNTKHGRFILAQEPEERIHGFELNSEVWQLWELNL